MEFATYAADHVNTLISEIRNVRVHEEWCNIADRNTLL